MKNLSRYAKMTRVSNAVPAGQTSITTTSIDTTSHESAQFVVLFGAISPGAATSVVAQGSSDNQSFEDLDGTVATVAETAGNQAYIVDIGHSRHRYLRCVINRGGANAVVDGVIAQQYMAQVEPVVHDEATIYGSDFHHAPASV